jgi:uncharacterized protein
MLSFSTQSLLRGAIQAKGDLDPDDKVWLEGDQRPLDGVRVSGRLSAAGEGRYYFSGKFTGSTLGECRRCLVEVKSVVSGEAHLGFVESGTEGEDDSDVFPLNQGRTGSEVDLRPALREQWLLDVPAFVLCRPDCKGLCPTCGLNLNQGECSHARKS